MIRLKDIKVEYDPTGMWDGVAGEYVLTLDTPRSKLQTIIPKSQCGEIYEWKKHIFKEEIGIAYFWVSDIQVEEY